MCTYVSAHYTLIKKIKIHEQNKKMTVIRPDIVNMSIMKSYKCCRFEHLARRCKTTEMEDA